MGAGVLDEIAAMAALLRERIGDPDAPLALRGSSMGGYLAIVAAPAAKAGAVIAICPASGEGLRRGLVSGRFQFEVDVAALEPMLSGHDLHSAVASLTIPLLLLHAEGDEQVPVEHSRELAERFFVPDSRLIAVPGGHHRSVQHDPELLAVSLRWLSRVLSGLSDRRLGYRARRGGRRAADRAARRRAGASDCARRRRAGARQSRAPRIRPRR